MAQNNTPYNLPKIVGLFVGPILFIVINLLPAPEILGAQGWKVISVALWMIAWWMTEAMPIPVTALLPMVLFPLLGVFDIKTATSTYANKIIYLFMGGFMIALAMEKRNLHKRIALNLIKLTGTHPNGIILGFMIATAFLSMWISNTATTVMMLPIATSVTALLHKEIKENQKHGFGRFSLSLMLGIAYAANIGGAMTIIGTPPNVVFAGYADEILNINIDFSSWIMVGVPVGVTMITISYIILTKYMYPSGLSGFEASEGLINEKIKELGRMSKGEKRVAIIFVLTALLWILRRHINDLLGAKILDDTIIAMSGGILMFLVPVDLRKGDFLLDWESMKRLPWGILILFGGGLCLAKAMETTGIIQMIGDRISENQEISIVLLVLILTTVMLFMTEIMSNVALATIFIPVVMGIAIGFEVDPLLLSIPVAFAASFAFMMPISTPPNAIVFSTGMIKMKEMMRVGLILNLISVAILLLMAFTLLQWVF